MYNYWSIALGAVLISLAEGASLHPAKTKSISNTTSSSSTATDTYYTVGVKTGCDPSSSTKSHVTLGFSDAAGEAIVSSVLNKNGEAFLPCTYNTFKLKIPAELIKDKKDGAVCKVSLNHDGTASAETRWFVDSIDIVPTLVAVEKNQPLHQGQLKMAPGAVHFDVKKWVTGPGPQDGITVSLCDHAGTSSSDDKGGNPGQVIPTIPKEDGYKYSEAPEGYNEVPPSYTTSVAAIYTTLSGFNPPYPYGELSSSSAPAYGYGYPESTPSPSSSTQIPSSTPCTKSLSSASPTGTPSPPASSPSATATTPCTKNLTPSATTTVPGYGYPTSTPTAPGYPTTTDNEYPKIPDYPTTTETEKEYPQVPGYQTPPSTTDKEYPKVPDYPTSTTNEEGDKVAKVPGYQTPPSTQEGDTPQVPGYPSQSGNGEQPGLPIYPAETPVTDINVGPKTKNPQTPQYPDLPPAISEVVPPSTPVGTPSTSVSPPKKQKCIPKKSKKSKKQQRKHKKCKPRHSSGLVSTPTPAPTSSPSHAEEKSETNKKLDGYGDGLYAGAVLGKSGLESKTQDRDMSANRRR